MVFGPSELLPISQKSTQSFMTVVQDYNYVLQNVIRSSLGLS